MYIYRTQTTHNSSSEELHSYSLYNNILTSNGYYFHLDIIKNTALTSPWKLTILYLLLVHQVFVLI